MNSYNSRPPKQMRFDVNTGKQQGLSAFQSISRALDPAQSLFSLS
jgi:hypothetical protein